MCRNLKNADFAATRPSAKPKHSSPPTSVRRCEPFSIFLAFRRIAGMVVPHVPPHFSRVALLFSQSFDRPSEQKDFIQEHSSNRNESQF